MKRLMWVCAAALLASVPAAAQGFDFSANYVYERWGESGQNFHMNGYALQTAGYVNNWLGLKGEWGQTWGDVETFPGFSLDTRHFWSLGGAVVSPYRAESGNFYIHALGGGGRFTVGDAFFQTRDSGGIFKLGAGFDWYPRGNAHVGIKIFEANYKTSWFFGSRQNVFQFQTGIVFSSGRR